MPRRNEFIHEKSERLIRSLFQLNVATTYPPGRKANNSGKSAIDNQEVV